MNSENVSLFMARVVPQIAAAHMGPGKEATFRQEFLEGLRAGLKMDGLDPIIRLEERILSGRTDARIAKFVFEFKSPGELRKDAVRKKGIAKLRAYVEELGRQEREGFRGLLTDGMQAAMFAFHPGSGKFLFVDAAGAPLPTGRELVPWAAIAGSLARMVGAMSLPRLGSDALLGHFGLHTALAQASMKALWRQLLGTQSELSKLLFGQWKELIALAVEFSVSNDPGEDLVELFQMGGGRPTRDEWNRAVFVVQSYYSILLKLLALRIVDELNMAGPVSLLKQVSASPQRGLIEAEATVPKVFGDVIERDVFSWPYCDNDAPPTVDVSAAIARMASVMETFDVQGVKTDVLRRVYQAIIPPKLRKSLGEFYTPTWAAEQLLNEIGFHGEGRLLDPTCGSGTFLVAAIIRTVQNPDETPTQRITRVCGSIVGYDLNPIAVATARLNYALTLVDTIAVDGLTAPLAIPVYLADSLILPSSASAHMRPHYQVKSHVAVFHVPIPYPDKPPEQIVRDVRTLLRVLRQTCTQPLEVFLAAVAEILGAPAEENNRPLLIELHRLVHSLHVKRKDGIWTSIVESFFAPILQGRFEFVVGNPPWVIPRETPSSYTDKVRATISESILDQDVLLPADRDFAVLKTRSAAAEQQYFACTPFVWRALRTYCVPGGKLAFLMTSSMFSTIGSGGWRKWVQQFDVNSIIDLTLITDIHEGALCWSFIPIITSRKATGKPMQYVFAVPRGGPKGGDLDAGPTEIEWLRWKVRLGEVPVTEAKTLGAGQERASSSAPWLVAPPSVLGTVRKVQARTAEINGGPMRLGDLYGTHMGFKADGWKFWAFAEMPRIHDEIAEGTNLAGERITIETKYVFPTAVASRLRPWGFEPGYAFLPLSPEGEDLDEQSIRRSPLAWRYLVEHKQLLEARAVVRKGYVHSWFGVLVPNGARTGTKVAYRLISRQLEASVLPAKVPLSGNDRVLLPDQSTRFIPVRTSEEGAFLAGLLNSTILRAIAYLCSTPKGGVPWRAFKAWNVGFVPVVRFDKGNEASRRTATIASQICADPAIAPSLQSDLDRAVGDVFGLTAMEVDAMAEHLNQITSGRAGGAGPDPEDEGAEDT